MGTSIQTNFRKPWERQKAQRSFTDSERAEMLEASDFDAVAIVFSFIGTLIDECCNTKNTADITKVITSYVDVVEFVYRKYMNPGCSNCAHICRSTVVHVTPQWRCYKLLAENKCFCFHRRHGVVAIKNRLVLPLQNTLDRLRKIETKQNWWILRTSPKDCSAVCRAQLAKSIRQSIYASPLKRILLLHINLNWCALREEKHLPWSLFYPENS